MPNLAKRLERLEAAVSPVVSPAEDEAARGRLVRELARSAEWLHDDALQRAALGHAPRNLAGESPATRLVHTAMTEAAEAGPWGSAAYVERFWQAVDRLLVALVTSLRSALCA